MKTPTRIVKIPFKYAMGFDGVDDYVEIPEPPVLAGARKATICGWVCSNKGYETFWDFVTEGWTGDWSIMYGWERLYARILYTDGTIAALDLGLHGFELGRWQFIAFGWDIDAGKLFGYNSYGNRWVTASVDPSKQPRNVYNKVRIGYLNTPLNGFVREVCIYSRALGTDEISWNYNNPGNPVKEGLVLHLIAHPDYVRDIDNDGRLEWIDLSGYGNHGKIYGATLREIIKSPARVLSPARIVGVV